MPSTIHVPAGQIVGQVTHSDDPRLPLGQAVGLRLADFEGISEPSATVEGVIFPVAVLTHECLPDGSSDVILELLGTEAP